MRFIVCALVFVLNPLFASGEPVWPPVLSIENGFTYLLPVIVWNLVFTKTLDIDRFYPATAPVPVLVSENVVRALVFLYPIFLKTDTGAALFPAGLGLYIGGSVLYYASWILIMTLPEDTVRNLPILSLAPAYTPVLFLTGMAVAMQSPLLAAFSLIFTGLHTLEYVLRMPRGGK